MSSAAVRVAVVGLGLVSPRHLDGYVAHPRAELIAVCDADPVRTARVAQQRGVPGTTDYRTILADPDVDAVALLLPHPLHHAIGLESLAAGKHVSLEKPITVTEREADDLIALAERSGLTLAVAENTRFVTAYVEAARLVQAGELGEIRLIRGFIPDQIIDEWADRSDPTQDWKREPDGCGAIIDCAPHMLYLLKWFFGDIASLQALAYRWVPDVPLENQAVIAGRLASGALFSMEFSSITEYPRGERVEIYGSAGTLVIDQVLDPPAVLYRGDRDLRGAPVAGVPYDILGWKGASIIGCTADFIGAIVNGTEPLVNARDSRYVVRLVEAAYASVARGGAAIEPPAADAPAVP